LHPSIGLVGPTVGRVARCGFMSRFGFLCCRSFTWCLALLISRQSLMCGGPRTSRVFSRNERHAESTRQVRYRGGRLRSTSAATHSSTAGQTIRRNGGAPRKMPAITHSVILQRMPGRTRLAGAVKLLGTACEGGHHACHCLVNNTPISDCSSFERNSNSIWNVSIVPPIGRLALGATGSKIQ
jgi:hypothetical protein